MRFVLAACLLSIASVPAFASPADVNAEEFYRDAVALQQKGMGAMFDKRTKPRMEQMKAAGMAAKARNDAATKRGNPIYCVSDAQRKKGMGPQQVVAMLGKVPQAQRQKSTLTDAWMAALVREYPC